ncbi:MAG: hypothetical protein K9J06_14110 [Flavobacteriales bacterium]|nr:hypothetical protein [Flavobacteriales bacterium]
MDELLLAFLDIIVWALPAAIIGWAALRVADRITDARGRETIATLRSRSRQETLPTRLQAYERLLLFLERSEPSNLILRLHRPGMSAALLQSELLKAIRNEYEHNLTQQIYVSDLSWSKVQEARDAVQQVVQAAGSKMGSTSTGIDLSNAIFAIIGQVGVSPMHGAIGALKREAQELVGV